MTSIPPRNPYFPEFCAECDCEFNGFTIEHEWDDKIFCSERCWLRSESWTHFATYICPDYASSSWQQQDEEDDNPMAGFVTPTPEELLADYDPDDYDYCAECERLQKAEESLPCQKCRDAILYPDVF